MDEKQKIPASAYLLCARLVNMSKNGDNSSRLANKLVIC